MATDREQDREALVTQLGTLEAARDEAVDEGRDPAYLASIEKQIHATRRQLTTSPL